MAGDPIDQLKADARDQWGSRPYAALAERLMPAAVELVEAELRAGGSDEGTGGRRRLRRPSRRRAGARAEERDTSSESVEESSEEATGDEPVGQPGDAHAGTSQSEPGPAGGDDSSDSSEENTSS